MKSSFTSKIRIIIILMFLITLIQSLVVFKLANQASIATQVQMDIKNTVYITMFIQFILMLFLIFYIPIFLHRSLRDLHSIIDEIAKGNYNIDIDLENKKNSMDKEFFQVMNSIQKMLKNVYKFDYLKKEKIKEHKNKIIALLNLSTDGFIIIDIEGKVQYINDIVMDIFPEIKENIDFTDVSFKPTVENNIKKYIMGMLKTKSKADAYQFYNPDLKRHITLNSAIIRNSEGLEKGIIIVFKNLQIKKEKAEKQSHHSEG